ncbi:MAG TPA: cbb3-type cytochrome c oxidase subunit I [Gemmatimonadales bacterium]|nr:cbb3-type cytochrome c oxidase subunit I [Gemmatimonadales bacterium]
MDPEAPTLNATNGSVLQAAIVYLVAGLGTVVVMGLLGLLMRLDHAGILVISADWFYRIMTLHGAGMVSGLLFAGFGGLAAVVSVDVRVSSRGLWIGLLVFLTGMMLVVFAIVFGAFAAGWTVLDPLPYQGKTWTVAAGVTVYIGYLFTGLAIVVVCATLLRATTAQGFGRALAWDVLFHPGRSHEAEVRPPVLIATVVAIVGLLLVVAGLAYLVPLLLEAAGAVKHVDTLLAKNTVFLFGHTMANLCIYVAAGLVYGTLPRFARRPWHTTWPVALAWNSIIFVIFFPWSHHLYQDFVQPLGLQILSNLGSFAGAFPSFVVTIVGALALVYGADLDWSPSAILMLLGVWGWVLGGLGAILDAVVPINQVMHNTMWVPAHFHTYNMVGVAAFVWAYLYHLAGELSDAPARRASRWAAWLYGIGAAGTSVVFFLEGAHSIPRRYAVHEADWQGYARVAIPFVVLMVIALAWLGAEILARIGRAYRRTRLAPS